jgi:alkylation response protein AidB-like acyl-CoA dehydrogenase
MAAQSTFQVDKRDVSFVLYEFLKADAELKKLPPFSGMTKNDFDMVVAEAAKMAVNTVAPVNAVCDRNAVQFDKGKVTTPPELKAAYKAYCEGGWLGLTGPSDFGGQDLPGVIGLATHEFFMGACCAFTMYGGLTAAASRLIFHYGTDEMKKTYLEKMYSGQWQGTMCLTEAGAGSAVGDLKTGAKKNGDHYLISGQKIFISAGEHDMCENFVHLVLARIEGAPRGMKGVSLFLVPKLLVKEDGSVGAYNDVQCVGIEHKMGIKGSATCTLSFGEEGKCKGYLIGEEHKGIQYMFLMMNEARIGVGIQGTGIAAAAYLEALKYANERIQGTDIEQFKNVDAPRVPIAKHPDVRRMLWTQKAYVEGCRALLYQTALWADMAQFHPDEDERNKAMGLLELMTPICKAYCTDMGFKVTELAIQTFGGYGYCQEYPVEQYMRDIKIASIYEGTNGIQAMDLLGRKVSMKGGMYLMTFLNELNIFCDQHAGHPVLGSFVKNLAEHKDKLAGVTMHFGGLGMSGDQLYPIYHAAPYLRFFGDVVVGWLLLRMALVAQEKLDRLCADNLCADDVAKKKLCADNSEAKFYDGKVRAAKFFISQLMPRVLGYEQAMMSGDRSGLETAP